MIALQRRYELDVAHHLTAGVPRGHKCRRVHGHRYIMTLEIRGLLNPEGMLIEYANLDRVIVPILRLVDHHDLNTLHERCSTAQAKWVADNPTVEHLAIWFAERFRLVKSARPEGGLEVESIRLEEDSRSAVVWRPDL